MTDKELRKLSRTDLLRLLLEESRENEQLRQRLAEAEEKLHDRSIRLEKAGSISEAALSLNGIFEAAQKAAEDYCRSVYARADEEAAAILQDARMAAQKAGDRG